MNIANPWPKELVINSKKAKLPKIFWVKGKSKFLHIRLHDEHKTNISELKSL